MSNLAWIKQMISSNTADTHTDRRVIPMFITNVEAHAVPPDQVSPSKGAHPSRPRLHKDLCPRSVAYTANVPQKEVLDRVRKANQIQTSFGLDGPERQNLKAETLS